MDQAKLDGIKPKRAWFARRRWRIWPWSLMGWLWTGLFFADMIGMLLLRQRLEQIGDIRAEWCFNAICVHLIVYLIVGYATSRKP